MMTSTVIELNTIALAIAMALAVRIFCIQSDSFALELWQTKQNIGSSRVNKLRPLPCSCVFQSAFLKDERTWQNYRIMPHAWWKLSSSSIVFCIEWLWPQTHRKKSARWKKVQKGREACFVCIVQKTSGAGVIWKCSLKPRSNKKSAPNLKTSQLSERSKRFQFSFVATIVKNQLKSLR